ncbi:hypothetical protein BKI52_39585 [marine bacterium AO1-C]|nr:hypothetical protein BKI52_39585 [marine bacterium AO1-C]
MNYHFERLTAENLAMLPEVFKQSYGRAVSLEYLRKKYTNHLNNETKYFGILAYEGGQVVGFNGAIPYTLRQGDDLQLAVQSLDSMVVPIHRKKGLFTTLFTHLQSQLREEDIACIFGLPNQASHNAFFNRLGWQPVHQIKRFHIPIQSKILSRVKHLSSTLTGNGFKNYFLPTPGKPWFISNDFVLIERDEAFFDYKQKLGNSFFIRLCGVKIWLKLQGIYLWIGDMELPETDAHFKEIIHRLQKLSSGAGVHEIIFQTSPDLPLAQMFARFYAPQPSWTLGVYNFSSNWNLSKLRITYGDLDNF